MGQTTNMVFESHSGARMGKLQLWFSRVYLNFFFGGARCDRCNQFPKSYVWVEKCVAKWVWVAIQVVIPSYADGNNGFER